MCVCLADAITDGFEKSVHAEDARRIDCRPSEVIVCECAPLISGEIVHSHPVFRHATSIDRPTFVPFISESNQTSDSRFSFL